MFDSLFLWTVPRLGGMKKSAINCWVFSSAGWVINYSDILRAWMRAYPAASIVRAGDGVILLSGLGNWINKSMRRRPDCSAFHSASNFSLFFFSWKEYFFQLPHSREQQRARSYWKRNRMHASVKTKGAKIHSAR